MSLPLSLIFCRPRLLQEEDFAHIAFDVVKLIASALVRANLSHVAPELRRHARQLPGEEIER